MQNPAASLESHHHTLVQGQMRVVERMASHLARRLPACVERKDLIQDGIVGLIEALLRWTQQTTGAHFENYMALRAHGAMLDGLRALDHGSRKVRKEMRRVELAIQHLGHSYGRAPLESEVAASLGLSTEEYQRILQEAHGYLLISLEDLGGDSAETYFDQCVAENADPLVVLERAALRQALASAVLRLPDQKQTLLALYYERDLKMHEIGSVLRLSEARISQLHTQTIAQLRSNLHEHHLGTLLRPRSKSRKASVAA